MEKQKSNIAHTYNIRPILPKDDETIFRIMQKAFEEFGAPLTGSVYNEPRMKHLSKEFTRKDAEYWVIENEAGYVLGGGGFYPTEGLPKGMAEIVKLYFSPLLRGQGMGLQLLKHIEQRARMAGNSKLYIESFPEFSKAVNLYTKFGFKHLSHALGNSGHTAVTIWMEKDL